MKNKKKYFLIYTAVFIVMALACFYVYYSRGLSFIYDGDGYSQHYKALIYYSDYLKEISHNIFVNHDFNFHFQDPTKKESIPKMDSHRAFNSQPLIASFASRHNRVTASKLPAAISFFGQIQLPPTA